MSTFLTPLILVLRFSGSMPPKNPSLTRLMATIRSSLIPQPKYPTQAPERTPESLGGAGLLPWFPSMDVVMTIRFAGPPLVQCCRCYSGNHARISDYTIRKRDTLVLYMYFSCCWGAIAHLEVGLPVLIGYYLHSALLVRRYEVRRTY